MSDFTQQDRELLHKIAKATVPGVVIPTSNLPGTEPWVPPLPTPKTPRERSTDAYWAGRIPKVQALRNMPIGPERRAAANTLALQGFLVDHRIEMEGSDPYPIMARRIELGYTWVNAVGFPVPSVPGIVFSGQAPYNPNKPWPAGSLPVTLDFAQGIE